VILVQFAAVALDNDIALPAAVIGSPTCPAAAFEPFVTPTVVAGLARFALSHGVAPLKVGRTVNAAVPVPLLIEIGLSISVPLTYRLIENALVELLRTTPHVWTPLFQRLTRA